MKDGVNKVLFYDLCKHYLPILVLSRQYLFGSSTFSVWFRKRAARAANNSHVWVLISAVQDLAVVLVDVLLQVRHTSVAYLDCVLVDYFVKWMVFWKISMDDSEKFCPHICLHIF